MTAKPVTNSVLPDEWCEAVLGEVAESMKNGLYKKAEAYADDGIPCLRMYNIGAGKIVWRDVKRMRLTEAELADYELLPGDLLVNRVNSRELVGKTALIPGGMERSVFESKNIRLRLDKARVVPAFINYQLLAFGSRYFDSNAQQVVGMASVSQKQLANFPIVLAPLRQQREIVAEIEKQFSRLDEAVANLNRVKANLKRYKAAVEGKLTEEWRKAHPDVEPASKLLDRILDERRAKWEKVELAKMEAKGKAPKNDKWKAKYKPPTQVDTAILPELPDTWGWSNFEQISLAVPNALKAGPFGSALKKSFYVPTGYKIYGQEQVIRDDPSYGDYYIDEERFQSLSACAVQPGDLLISLVGTIGRVLILPENIEPGIINPRLMKISLDQRVVAPLFIKAYLQSVFVKHLFKLASHGGTMDILNLPILKAIPIPLPSMEEQRGILNEVDRHLSLIHETEAQLDTNLKRAERLRQALLAKAFSGELTGRKLQTLPEQSELLMVAEPAGVYGANTATIEP